MYCTKCGKKLEGRPKYCTYCGAKILAPDSPDRGDHSNKPDADPIKASPKRGIAIPAIILTALVSLAVICFVVLQNEKMKTTDSQSAAALEQGTDETVIEEEAALVQETDDPAQETDETASAEETVRDDTDNAPYMESTTLFGGENFTVGCDGNTVTMPCTYNDFIAQTGMELRDNEYTLDPDRNPADDGKDYDESTIMYVPGSDEYLSLNLSVVETVLRDGGTSSAVVYKNNQPVFKAGTYGKCQIQYLYVIRGYHHDHEQQKRMTFACGITLYMSQDEIHERLGEPYHSRQHDEYAEEFYLDGLQSITIGYKDGIAESIQMNYGEIFSNQLKEMK